MYMIPQDWNDKSFQIRYSMNGKKKRSAGVFPSLNTTKTDEDWLGVIAKIQSADFYRNTVSVEKSLWLNYKMLHDVK